MNQLISCCDDYVIIGLKDTAFLVNCQSNSIVELKKRLEIQQPTTSKSSSKDEDSEIPSTEKSEDSKKEKLEDERNMIHAVAISVDNESVLFCAVARGNKSLDLYKLDTRTNQSTEILPYMVYNTAKRLSCMCFSSWPVAESGTTTSSSTNATNLLLGGDLAGDAYAYCLDEKRHCQRLLLGHTASMLTGLYLSNSVLLTADRDEKIRISSFPQTYIIEGFLMGHEAYITSIDVTTNGLVVTSGGDCTIRLWNLETQSELFVLSVPKNGETKEEESQTSGDFIPIDLCFNATGSLLAVIFDQSNRLDLYRVSSSGGNGPNLERIQSVECSSQPLGVCSQGTDCFCIAQRDPHFFTRYQVKDGLLSDDNSQAIQELRKAADNRKLVMQETILERDRHGQIKLGKLHETRGPAAGDEPWNRSERVEIAKKANKRHKRRKLGKQ